MFLCFLEFLALSAPFVSSHSTNFGLNRAAKAAGKLYFGSATNDAELIDAPYVAILSNSSEFGQVTPAHGMKWEEIEPGQDTFTFAAADQFMDFAKTNGKRVRGHNLVWHERLPSWVTNGTWTNATLTDALEKHIKTIAGRYAGTVYAWDVVNEPFNEDGTFGSDVFLETIGEAYIPIALRAARAADSAAKLYINEFNIEGPGAKTTAFLNLVRSLKEAGVPIDGVGFQCHFIVGEVPSGIRQNIEAFVALGVEVAITELDIRMTLPSSPALLLQQQKDYKTAVSACNAVQGCVGITVWDFTDKYSWIPGTFTGQGAACPWDSDLLLKPAYQGIIAGLAQ